MTFKNLFCKFVRQGSSRSDMPISKENMHIGVWRDGMFTFNTDIMFLDFF